MGRLMSAVALTLGAAALAAAPAPAGAQQFTLEQVRGYPFPQDLVAAASGEAIAWVVNQRGVRNIWAARGPAWTPRQLTRYTADDGQQLSQLEMTADGDTVVYVRGGDDGANWEAPGNLAPDPGSSPIEPRVAIWAVSDGSAPRALAEGGEPALAPRGGRVAFVRKGQVWAVPLDGSRPAAPLFFDRGTIGSLRWSPDGSRLAFVTDRGDHAFIGVFTSDSQPILYLAPSVSRDESPRWSPDGTRIAFVRRPGDGGPPQPFLTLEPHPWAIWVADAATGRGHEVWRSPTTLLGSFPTTHGEANLTWVAGDRLLFLADLDNWPHLYAVGATGGTPTPLTPGASMVEVIGATPDRRWIVYSGNGANPGDDDRRHIFKVGVAGPGPEPLTSGDGLEWAPVVTGDGAWIAFMAAGARRPPLVAVMPLAGGSPRLLDEASLADFPTAALVVPRRVVFDAPDGTPIHGQLFERPGLTGKHPGVVFVHGGPQRQMLLGWNPMAYYANAYAVNQYLAGRGYVVLSVNYRLGVGYGQRFNHPPHAGPAGAAEYQDVLAGGRWLAALPEVDPRRVGIWGGSYGGYLTALALALNSDVFAAGSDMHGVHDWTYLRYSPAWRPEQADLDSARVVAWESSPDAHIATWKSPVLLIQGDDDRNVHFHQTVDLARRLALAGVPHQVLVIPDEIHEFLRFRSWITADSATAAFFDRTIGAP